MSGLPEIRAEIDERGRMTYRAMDAAVLLSKDEQDEILRKFADLQSENAKLRELARLEHECNAHAQLCEFCPHNGIDFEHEDISCDVTDNIERLRSELDVEGK